MPTYFSTGTRVRLSVSSLPGSTTAQPVWKKSAEANKNTLDVEAAIRNGDLLGEEAVADEDGHHMRYLGDRGNIPFYLVRTGLDLRQSDAEGVLRDAQARAAKLRIARLPEQDGEDNTLDSVGSMQDVETWIADTVEKNDGNVEPKQKRRRIPSRRQREMEQELARRGPSTKPSGPSPTPAPRQVRGCSPSGPLALTLNVFLSSKLFLRSFDKIHQCCGIKIDVFFNGQFAAASLISARYKNDAHNSEELTQRFSGTRVNNLLEHAWVIVPYGHNSDGSLRAFNESQRVKGVAQARWKEIGEALEKEVEIRGPDRHGMHSPVAEYLASLARLEMPKDIDKMHKKGAPQLGVIDVVVSVGKGKKHSPTAGYISKPTRLEDRDFKGAVINGDYGKAGMETEGSIISTLSSERRRMSFSDTTSARVNGTTMPTPRDSSPARAQIPDKRNGHGIPSNGYQAPARNTPFTPKHARSFQQGYQNKRTERALQMTPEQSGRQSLTLSIAGNGTITSSDPFVGNGPREGQSTVSTPSNRRRQLLIGQAGHTPFTNTSLVFQQSELTNIFSSPDDGRHTRGQMRASSDGLEGPSFQTASPLSQTPDPFISPAKPGARTMEAEASTSKLNATEGTQAVRDRNPVAARTRSKHYLPPVPITPPKRQRIGAAAFSSAHVPSQAPASPLDARESVRIALRNGAAPGGPLLKRIVLKARGRLVRDVQLQQPFALGQEPMLQGQIPETFSIRDFKAQIPVDSSDQSVSSRSITFRTKGSQSSASLEQLPPKVLTPELSWDAVASYARPGPWCDSAMGGAGGPYRQIRSQRSGNFKEDSILLGVRYVIG